jgi:hypothetical protein
VSTYLIYSLLVYKYLIASAPPARAHPRLDFPVLCFPGLVHPVQGLRKLQNGVLRLGELAHSSRKVAIKF